MTEEYIGMDSSHSGKISIVTGAAAGIGAASAAALAHAGATVVLVDREAGAVARTARRIGGRAEHVVCDVTVPEDVEALVTGVVQRHGRLDLAFNNAGILGEIARTGQCTEANFAQVIDVNVRGVWRCMRHEINAMLASGGGSIVNTASVAGKVGFDGAPAYAASKHAVLGLTRTAALEYARKGIRVNAVCPGTIDTPMVTRFAAGDEATIRAVAAAHPMHRLGTPAEVAAAVVWLTSDAASFVTGSALDVDGGFLSR